MRARWRNAKAWLDLDACPQLLGLATLQRLSLAALQRPNLSASQRRQQIKRRFHQGLTRQVELRRAGTLVAARHTAHQPAHAHGQEPVGDTAKAASSLASSPTIKAVEAPQSRMISSKAWPLSGADVGTMFTTL